MTFSPFHHGETISLPTRRCGSKSGKVRKSIIDAWLATNFWGGGPQMRRRETTSSMGPTPR